MRKQRDGILAVSLPLIARFASAQPSLPDIRDALEPLTLPEETHRLAFSIATVAVLLLAVAIWLIWRSRARLRQSAMESAEARAHRRLGIIEYASPRVFYTELHDVFIEYLESRVVTESSRRTTPELIEVLETSGIQVDWQRSIKDLLYKCDNAKFSPLFADSEPAASVAECLGLIKRLATLPSLSRIKRSRA